MPQGIERRITRSVNVGTTTIGGEAPISVQSMAATRTRDIEATLGQIYLLQRAGADIIRVAVDSIDDVNALAQIRDRTDTNLAVDLQENWPLAPLVARNVDKIRYNPGHLYHIRRARSAKDKVAEIAEAAERNDCALRIGVNCGSVDPEITEKYGKDQVGAMVESALMHSQILDDLGFKRYVVSLKDSNPKNVIEANSRFAKARPDIPLHLGVTEAGIPNRGGVAKTRMAFEPLLSAGVGETLRVSLTVPFEKKGMEVEIGRQIIQDVNGGTLLSLGLNDDRKVNIISCPSCSRVENEVFVHLAEQVDQMTAAIDDTLPQGRQLTIAVMGCRVNGPGETDHADIGVWCGPTHVNLKRGAESLGSFTYDEILFRLQEEIDHFNTSAYPI